MYRLISSVGRPADECLSISRILVRGVFERYPTLKFVGCHLGGGICEVIGRLNYAYELGDFCFFLGSYEPLLISKAPGEYLKMMYMDTAAYHWPAVMCAINTIGIDHMSSAVMPHRLRLSSPRQCNSSRSCQSPARRKTRSSGRTPPASSNSGSPPRREVDSQR